MKRRKDYAEEKARRIGGNAQQGITLRNKGPKDLESEALRDQASRRALCLEIVLSRHVDGIFFISI